jgi:putative protease
MGLLELPLPPIPLFASTQTHNNTPEKVVFLEKAGFSRIILARELSLADIKKIRAKTGAELEFFAHGALCVSHSGQCWLSCALGGRSGNRGECAQPCRKLYSLKDGAGNVLVKEKHFLSLRDLNLAARLGDLIDAGITSLKIEGRLKDSDYVRNVVSFYRRELDKALAARRLAKSSAGRSFIDFTPDLNKTFNRGYTEYLLDGANADIASPDSPKFIGEPVGKAVKVGLKSFRLDGQCRLNNGDGIAFFDSRGVLSGTHVNIVQNGNITPVSTRGIAEGTLIYRNLDREFSRTLERAKPERKIGVRLEFSETADGFLLRAMDEEGFKAEMACSPGKTKADKPEAALETIKKQLSKTGDSGFYLLELKTPLQTAYFIPVSVLNDIRRQVLERLAKVREPGYKRVEARLEKTSHKYPEKELDFTANVLNLRAVEFYKRHGAKVVERAPESGTDLAGRPLMTMKLCLRRRLNLCPKEGAAGPAESLYLEDEEKRLFRLDFDCPNCQMTLRK